MRCRRRLADPRVTELQPAVDRVPARLLGLGDPEDLGDGYDDAVVLTGVAAALIRPARHLVRTVTLTMVGACVVLAAFTVAPTLALAFAAVSVCQILTATRIQQTVPERLRGVITGFNAITQSGLTGVAAAAMAFTAAGLGARAVIIIITAATITAVTGLLVPLRMRRSGHASE